LASTLPQARVWSGEANYSRLRDNDLNTFGGTALALASLQAIPDLAISVSPCFYYPFSLLLLPSIIAIYIKMRISPAGNIRK
jgi:hypothetical protein